MRSANFWNTGSVVTVAHKQTISSFWQQTSLTCRKDVLLGNNNRRKVVNWLSFDIECIRIGLKRFKNRQTCSTILVEINLVYELWGKQLPKTGIKIVQFPSENDRALMKCGVVLLDLPRLVLFSFQRKGTMPRMFSRAWHQSGLLFGDCERPAYDNRKDLKWIEIEVCSSDLLLDLTFQDRRMQTRWIKAQHMRTCGLLILRYNARWCFPLAAKTTSFTWLHQPEEIL